MCGIIIMTPIEIYCGHNFKRFQVIAVNIFSVSADRSDIYVGFLCIALSLLEISMYGEPCRT